MKDTNNRAPDSVSVLFTVTKKKTSKNNILMKDNQLFSLCERYEYE
jgi:hypothetical protein